MRSGMVAVIGRPNVGKSSLVNALVGEKISIVTRKPQTTRHRVQGVVRRPAGQIVLVDTPGLHRGGGRALNRHLNDVAAGSIEGVDLVLFVVEAGAWKDEDDVALERLRRCQAPVALVINKVDRLTDKQALLPEIEQHRARREFVFVVPLSALKRDNLEALVQEALNHLPEGQPLYGDDDPVAPDPRFMLAELVREKLMQKLQQEVPYALTVEVEAYEAGPPVTRASAAIWVEREGQKAIVIGQGGGLLKQVGSATRRELEQRLGHKVFLKLWVGTRAGWTDDPEALKKFGYVSS
ncbi:MAG TPA: GTPase Era [Candidatus Binatia bacterium]|nr:GTPase Era [Candidatus Binatia bacterium]